MQIFPTGVEAFDRLARDCPEEFQSFLDRVRAHGWIVKATDKLRHDIAAEFFPRKRRFYYHPERTTIMVMLHEAKHLELFERRGNFRPGSGQLARDELEVYRYEFELGRQHGFSARYMSHLEGWIARFEKMLSGPEPPRSSWMPDPFMKRFQP